MYACNDNAVLNCRKKQTKRPQEPSYNAMAEVKSHVGWQQPLQTAEIKAACGKGGTILHLLYNYYHSSVWISHSAGPSALMPNLCLPAPACIKCQNKALKVSGTQESVKLAKQVSKDIYWKVPITYLISIIWKYLLLENIY